VQHHVVRPGDGDDERAAGRPEQQRERVGVVAVDLGVVGVADVHAHGQAEQLAAEVVLQAGADHLLAVVEVLRPDEPDDGVDQQRREVPRHRVGARLQRLLVDRPPADPAVRVGRQRRPLAGLEVRDVVAHGAAAQFQGAGPRLREQVEGDAEAPVGRLRAGDRLEHEVHRRALLQRAQRRRHVGEHARLGGDVVAADDRVDQFQQRDRLPRGVGRRVDADDGVAGALQQPVDDRGRDAERVVGRVVGLQPGGEPAGQAQRAAQPRHDPGAPADRDQIGVAHQLRRRRHHLGRQPGRQPADRGLVPFRRPRQEPVAELSDGERGDRRERGGVVGVDDQPRDVVLVVAHHLLLEEGGQRQVGEHGLGGHPLGGRLRRTPGQHVA
jgi:hypothetical protein